MGDAVPGAPMRRVLVSGISGAGKSTLARELAAGRGLPYVELDALHHGPGWVKRPEFESDVERLASGDAWITEDQYHSVIGDVLWLRAQLVVWLDLPRVTIMRRVVWRTARRLVLRQRLYNGNRERWRDVLFSRGHPIRWAWTQHAGRRRHIGELVRAHPQVVVVRLRSAREVDQWLVEQE